MSADDSADRTDGTSRTSRTNKTGAQGSDRGRIIYRPVRWDDLDAMSEEFDRTWGVAVTRADPAARHVSHLVSRHFVLHYLQPSTFGVVAQNTDGAFMGVALGRVVGRPVLFAQTDAELARVDAELDATTVGSGALARTNAWHALEERLESDTSINERTQGEIELFIVAQGARGHGVGGTLWRRTMAAFAAEKAVRYYLHTDTSCDTSFYDHQGLERIVEWHADEHPDDQSTNGCDVFIYEGGVPNQYEGAVSD